MKTVLKQCSALNTIDKCKIPGQDQTHTVFDVIEVIQIFNRKAKIN